MPDRASGLRVAVSTTVLCLCSGWSRAGGGRNEAMERKFGLDKMGEPTAGIGGYFEHWQRIEWYAWMALCQELERLGVDPNEQDELVDRCYRWAFARDKARLCSVGKNSQQLDSSQIVKLATEQGAPRGDDSSS